MTQRLEKSVGVDSPSSFNPKRGRQLMSCLRFRRPLYRSNTSPQNGGPARSNMTSAVNSPRSTLLPAHAVQSLTSHSPSAHRGTQDGRDFEAGSLTSSLTTQSIPPASPDPGQVSSSLSLVRLVKPLVFFFDFIGRPPVASSILDQYRGNDY